MLVRVHQRCVVRHARGLLEWKKFTQLLGQKYNFIQISVAGDEGVVRCACATRERLRHVAHRHVTTRTGRPLAQRSRARLLRDVQVRGASAD